MNVSRIQVADGNTILTRCQGSDFTRIYVVFEGIEKAKFETPLKAYSAQEAGHFMRPASLAKGQKMTHEQESDVAIEIFFVCKGII